MKLWIAWISVPCMRRRRFSALPAPATNRPIGVFDSGLGGLTVARCIATSLPHESIYYLGDTKRCPYGVRSEEEVRSFVMQAGRWLAERDIKIMVIACNTATAAGLRIAQQLLPVPVIGVIAPGPAPRSIPRARARWASWPRASRFDRVPIRVRSRILMPASTSTLAPLPVLSRSSSASLRREPICRNVGFRTAISSIRRRTASKSSGACPDCERWGPCGHGGARLHALSPARWADSPCARSGGPRRVLRGGDDARAARYLGASEQLADAGNEPQHRFATTSDNIAEFAAAGSFSSVNRSSQSSTSAWMSLRVSDGSPCRACCAVRRRTAFEPWA